MFGKKNIIHTKMDATTYIGNGMKIEGKLRCVGPIRIDGEIQGDIDCQSEVSIGPSAHIEATIHAAKILINGRIEGNLFTSDQLEVMSEGHIIGNVSTPPGQLIIHEGGVIEGQCITYDVPQKTTTQDNQAQLDAPLQKAKLIEPSQMAAKEAVAKA